MKKNNQLTGLNLFLTASALLLAASSCAPANSPTTTLTPPGQGQLQFPGGNQGGYTSDFSQVPSQYNSIINNLLGTYLVSVQIEPMVSNQGVRTIRSLQLTLTRHTNTTNNGGVPAWGTLEIVLPASGNFPEVKSTVYLGVNPNPLYGRYFQFATPAFSMPELSDSPIALQLYLAVNSQHQFDAANSGIIAKDCSLSGGVICSNSSYDLAFGNDLRRR